MFGFRVNPSALFLITQMKCKSVYDTGGATTDRSNIDNCMYVYVNVCVYTLRVCVCALCILTVCEYTHAHILPIFIVTQMKCKSVYDTWRDDHCKIIY